ncbi:MAG: hypothetical protein ACLUIQ_08925 [Dialister invisus]
MAAGIFLTVMVILIGRLAYVQIFDHARYVALAKNEVEKNEELYSPAVRFMTVTAISWQFL